MNNTRIPKLHFSKRRFNRSFWRTWLTLSAITLVWVMAIFSAAGFHTSDLFQFQTGWWDYLAVFGFGSILQMNLPTSQGGAGANYTTIWYFIIYGFIKLGIYKTFNLSQCLKLIGIPFVIGTAVVTYHIIKELAPQRPFLSFVGYLGILFLPSTLLDLLKTNLPDSSYLFFALLGYLFLLKNKPFLAWTALGIACSFKLMAIYILPLFVIYYLKGFIKSSIKYKLAPSGIILGVALMSLPYTLLSKGDWYHAIISTWFSRVSGNNNLASLVQWSTTIWQLLPMTIKLKTFAYLMTFLVVLIAVIGYLMSARWDKNKLVLQHYLPILFPVLCFYFLPFQLETYYSLSVIFAFITFLIYPQKDTFILFAALSALLTLSFVTVSFVSLPYSNSFQNSVLNDKALLSLVFGTTVLFLIYKILSTLSVEQLMGNGDNKDYPASKDNSLIK